MRWKGLRRRISVPGVPSMTDDAEPPPRPSESAGGGDRPPIDRSVVQYLDRVRAIFRPTCSDGLAPGLERFIGQEDVFRHVGTSAGGTSAGGTPDGGTSAGGTPDGGTSDGPQPMMECPVHWPASVKWVPIRDLEIVEILEDQDVRAG
jgi:hypothetical protein